MTIKTKKKYRLLNFAIFLIILFSCESKREKKEEVSIQMSSIDSLSTPLQEISFYFYEEKNDYPDAIIEMFSPMGNQILKPGKIPFEFNIKNYPYAQGLSGFQLKLILNSEDPIGYNMPIFQKELPEGNYRAVAYLVDQEGLMLKEFGNYVDRNFRIGKTISSPYSAEPYLAVNLPTDGQEFSTKEEITIDFLVLAGALKLDKLKVEISIDDMKYEISQVTPVRIANLPRGEHNIVIKLVHLSGKELDGPFSTIRKKVSVK